MSITLDRLALPAGYAALEARIAALEAVNAAVLSENIKLRAGVKKPHTLASALNLTMTQWHLLERLLADAPGHVAASDLAALLPRGNGQSERNAVSVHIGRLRDILTAHGMWIHNARGFGYYIEEKDAVKLRGMV